MLCPICGTDVGDRSQLCESCLRAAKSSSSSSAGSQGTQIGAIRPAVRVVRLNPGEVHPSQIPDSQREAESKQLANKPSLSPGLNAESYSSSESYRARSSLASNRPRPWWILVFSIAILAASAVYLRRNPELFDTADEANTSAGADFSHIVIHERREVVVDGERIKGALTIDEAQIPLSKTVTQWNPQARELQINYFVAEDSSVKESEKESATESNSNGSSESTPDLQVTMQFQPETKRLDTTQLKSYTVTFLVEGKPYSVARQYSKQLAAFGEASQFSGLLQKGERVRGSMRDSRSVNISGTSRKVSWALVFDEVLTIANR